MTERWFASAYGRVIAIETGGVPVALPFLPPPWTSDRPDAAVDRTYRIEVAAPDQLQLAIDDEPSVKIPGLGLLGDRIEGDLHHWLATYTRGFLFVHAGCVSWRGRGIVIPGRSHAGKTTLTRALVEIGATYYSDDYAVIDPGGAIWPFPRRLHVRPIAPGPSHRVDPFASNWPVGAASVRAALVADVRFDPERGWAVEPLSHGQGALSLLDNTVAARERPQDSLRMMTNVMEGTLAIKGTRDVARKSARRLLEMVDDLLEGRR